MEIPEALSETTLCRGLTPDQVGKLAETATLEHYDADTLIFEEDNRGRDLYVLVDGCVTIEAKVPGEADRGEIIVTLRPGSLFGEFSLLDGSPRSASAKAMDHVHVLRMDHRKLTDLMEAHSEIGYKVVRNIAELLTTRIRNTNLRWRNAMVWGS